MPKKTKPAPDDVIKIALDSRTRALFRAAGAKGGRIGGPKGGKNRWAGMSPEERRAHAQKAAAARWKNVGPEERSRLGRTAVRARIAKRHGRP
jgi:hypothetical protein